MHGVTRVTSISYPCQSVVEMAFGGCLKTGFNNEGTKELISPEFSFFVASLLCCSTVFGWAVQILCAPVKSFSNYFASRLFATIRH
jgi:hypothetical protein